MEDKMAARAALFGITSLATLGFSGAIAQPNACSDLAPQVLYVLAPCADNLTSHCPVPAQSAMLKQNVSYRFLYKTPPTDILKSLIVVHVKGLASHPVATPVTVRVSRQHLAFACKLTLNPFSKTRYYIDPKLAYPANAENAENAFARREPPYNEAPTAEVDYNGYDHFNRYGDATQPTSGILKQIHANYFNGSECVPTMEAVRRAQFLFIDRDQVPDFTTAFTTEIGITKPTASADSGEINRYDHLQVIVANYEKQAQTSGCISFVVRSTGPSLEIDMSDLEEKVRTTDLYEKFHSQVFVLPTP
jgi:hypothetical protein